MQKISNKAQAIEIDGENKETWLDELPTKEVIKFANENIKDEKVGLLTMARYYVGETMYTSRFALLDKDNPVYDFTEYLACKTDALKTDIQLTELAKAWIMFVGDFNKDRVIDGKTYYETVIDILKSVYGQDDEEAQQFIECLELINSL